MYALYDFQARIEGRNGILGILQLLGAFWTGIFNTICLIAWTTAAYFPELRTAQEIKLLHEFGFFIIDLPALGTMVQCISFGIVFLLDKRKKPLVPSWLCWFSFWVAFTYIADLVIVFFRKGPFCVARLILFLGRLHIVFSLDYSGNRLFNKGDSSF